MAKHQKTNLTKDQAKVVRLVVTGNCTVQDLLKCRWITVMSLMNSEPGFFVIEESSDGADPVIPTEHCVKVWEEYYKARINTIYVKDETYNREERTSNFGAQIQKASQRIYRKVRIAS